MDSEKHSASRPSRKAFRVMTRTIGGVVRPFGIPESAGDGGMAGTVGTDTGISIANTNQHDCPTRSALRDECAYQDRASRLSAAAK